MKNQSAFNHYDLKLVEPDFGSVLTDLVIELDYLRKKKIEGSTHPAIFFQLKSIFHTLESIGSARIEGNRTTIAEFIETKTQLNLPFNEDILEIKNSEDALEFIDDNIADYPINRMFVSELHKKVVKNLTKEGSKSPGKYRPSNIIIAGANHIPPDYCQVEFYMKELFDFIDYPHPSKYDLIKTALAHHRFAWIHPFDNGNGRTVRLFTYAMLVKQGFNVDIGRIINPTAVFCNSRDKYYSALSKADTGLKNGLLNWCEYVLSGLKLEIEKIDNLLNYNFLKTKILIPSINYSFERKLITEIETKILRLAVEKQLFKAADVKKILPNKLSAEISRLLRKLRQKNMIVSENNASRKYIISFTNNFLLRSVIYSLDKNGFLPITNE